MKLPAYPKYKSSGVEWLGDVPEDWDVKRLKYSASINDETLPETTEPDFEFRYVDIGGVNAVDGIVSQEEMIFENAPSRARRIVKDGDTIVSTVRTYLRAIAPIKNPPSNLIVSTGFAVVRPREVQPDFLSYALRESSFVETVVARSSGVSYPAVNASDVATISIPLPPLAEQRAIADFLEARTAKIDALLSKRRALIEKLKEKRTALISRAVTRGLNSNAKLKPSGVEWLGDVPEHWEIDKHARRFRSAMGNTILKEDLVDDGKVPVYSATESGAIFGYVDNPNVQLFAGDIVIPARGISIGYPVLIKERSTSTQTTIYSKLLDRRNIHSPFVYYFMIGHRESLFYFDRTAIPQITVQQVSSNPLPIPPKEEQIAIVEFLDRETGKIDRMMGKVETAIETLQEYRTALITAAVTGKIDVRKET